MLIEAVTYRLSDHTTADDASRYRSAADLDAAWQREPLRRLRTLLTALSLWSGDDERAWLTECRGAVEAAVARYLAAPAPAPEDLFEHHYARWPEALAAQREELRARVARRAGGGA